MATAYLTSYFAAGEVAMGYPLDSEQVTTNAGSFTESAAIDAGGRSNRVRVSCDTDLAMERGPSADGTGHLERIPANSTEYFWVAAGDVLSMKEI